ncbi:MAG: FkbM family methyltransferase [Bacilli bacterium]|nr:FkbM family methyltransferase [Bacilli bacterium]
MHVKKKIKKISLFLAKPFLPNKSVICDGPGFKIRIRPPKTSTIGRSLYFKKIWEPKMTKVVQDKVKEGWYILDVGADIGYYSLLFALKSGAKGKVVCFEPDPEPWPYLKDNIAMFENKNIIPYALALSDHEGLGMMKLGGKGQLYPDQKSDSDVTNTVKMVVFDDFFPKLSWNKIDLIKIDVEGAELSVLKGMKKTINKYHPKLLIEIHPRQLKNVFNSSSEELFDYLTNDLSYELTPVDHDRLIIPKDGNITVWAEWIKRKKEI